MASGTPAQGWQQVKQLLGKNLLWRVKSRQRACGGCGSRGTLSFPPIPDGNERLGTKTLEKRFLQPPPPRLCSPPPPGQGTFLLRFREMLYPDPLLPTPWHTPYPGALRCRPSTHLKSQSTGSGPTAADRRAQTTSASRNLCGCGSKASTPSPPASPSAPGPSPLVRAVLAGGLGTRKPIGRRACHISWVESWENNRRAPGSGDGDWNRAAGI